jgi:hypothetical protein
LDEDLAAATAGGTMHRSTSKLILAAAVAFGLSLSGTANVSAAPADDGAGSAAKTESKPAAVKHARAKRRAVRSDQAGLVQLHGPVTLGASTRYWYRPTFVVSGRPARRQQVYVLSAEPKSESDPRWQCCIMLGIGY